MADVSGYALNYSHYTAVYFCEQLTGSIVFPYYFLQKSTKKHRSKEIFASVLLPLPFGKLRD